MVDLHLHLSSSVPIESLWEMVVESGFKTKSKTYAEFRSTFLMKRENVHNLDEYLALLHAVDKVQSSPHAVKKSVYRAYVASAMAGCTALELRFNPTKRSDNGNIDLDSIIVAARAGMERARVNFGIEGGLTLCMGRDCTPEANEAVYKKALKYVDKGVVGIDIAGPYDYGWWKGTQGAEYAAMYENANRKGLITTVHVGEKDYEGSYDELAWVIDHLKPSRIGHGIQITKFPQLMTLAQKAGIVFEVCPTSNVTTGVVKDWHEMSNIAMDMVSANLNIEVCTDSTTLIGTNIVRENEIFKSLVE